MKGLLKNNYYAARSNVKLFSIAMVLLGIAAAVMDNDVRGIIIGYMVSVMAGFSVAAVSGLRKENTSKWCRYKLTAPVRRIDIVKSYFLSQLIWLLVGMLFAAAGVSCSILLHGFPFDRNTDIFMIFVVGIGLSLFMGAIFFPLFYLGGEERSELCTVVSLLGSIGVVMGASSLMNRLFPHMTTFQLVLAGIVILACAALAFLLSFPLTVFIFRRKEF